MLKLVGVILVLVIFAAPVVAEAQPAAKIARIGWLLPFSPRSRGWPTQEAFRRGLRDLGYVEGQNITIEYLWGEEPDRLPDLAAKFVGLQVDVIFTVGTAATLAAKQATKTIPIVFVAVGDPVGSEVVANLARPSGNITGLTHIAYELDAKRLELLNEIVPGRSRVAVLLNPDFSPHRESLKSVEVSASALRVGLRLVEFRRPEDFEGAIANAKRGGAGALLIMAHPLTFEHKTRLPELAARSRLPAISPFREFAEAGGFIAYGASLPDIFRRAAYFVDKILKGAKPADLPIEQPTKFELILNAKTAKSLGLTIPPSLLARADQLIE